MKINYHFNTSLLLSTDYKPGTVIWIILFNTHNEVNRLGSSIVHILQMRKRRHQPPVYFAILQVMKQFNLESIQKVYTILTNKYLLSDFYHMVLY